MADVPVMMGGASSRVVIVRGTGEAAPPVPRYTGFPHYGGTPFIAVHPDMIIQHEGRRKPGCPYYSRPIGEHPTRAESTTTSAFGEISTLERPQDHWSESNIHRESGITRDWRSRLPFWFLNINALSNFELKLRSIVSLNSNFVYSR